MTALLVAISLLTVSVAFAADDGNRQNSVAETDIALSNQKVDEADKLYDSGNYGDAVQSASEAIELKPDYAAAYNNRGNSYNALKQYERAIDDYDKAVELDPSYAAAYSNRGNSYNDLGQYERAIQDLDKAIELDPNLAVAHYNRGKCYEALGDTAKAQADFDKAKALGYSG